MLKEIKELKKQANIALQKNYWKIMFVSAILMIVSFGTVYGMISDSVTNMPELFNDISSHFERGGHEDDLQVLAVVITLVGGMLFLSSLFKILLSVFIENPVEIGVKMFMKKNMESEEPGRVADVAYSFDNHYLKTVKSMFIRDLYSFLWSLLLIIPGIVKRYEYRLVPYLLPSHSELDAREVLQLSKEYMKGNKKKALVLDLVFLPWHFLGLLTFGILEVMYVQPYKDLVNAAFYLEVLNSGKEAETHQTYL